MDFLYAVLGLVILVLAGDLLVRGAVNVSLRLGVPALIVSLTIVSVGTSFPELLISVESVLKGAPGIAMGNIVGSNTANVLLVLGLPAMLVGIGTTGCDCRHSYVQMIFATVVFTAIAFLTPITWVHGIVLLVIFTAFILYSVHSARAQKMSGSQLDAEELEGASPGMRWRKILFFLALGLAGLPLGADILVESATHIARRFDISETVIGLTLVAVGTSLPELATTISAAFRRQADVALGNIIGSNIANLLLIIGAASLIGPIPVAAEILHFDLWVMIAASLLLAPFVIWKRDISRLWGTFFTGLYLVYIVFVLT